MSNILIYDNENPHRTTYWNSFSTRMEFLAANLALAGVSLTGIVSENMHVLF